MIRMTLPQLLERQRGVVKSIDLRAIAVREGEAWHNGVTVIRFSAHEKERVRRDQAQLRARLTDTATEDMQVVLEAFDIGYLDTLRQQLQTRLLVLGDCRIQFEQNVDILGGSGFFPYRYPISTPSGGWPALECRFPSGSYHLNTEAAAMAAQQVGFPDARALAREIMEFNVDRDEQLGLLVHLPFWATVRTWGVQGNVLTVLVEAHRELTDLALRVFITGSRSQSLIFQDSADLSGTEWKAIEGELVGTSREFSVEGVMERVRAEPTSIFGGEPRADLKLVLAHGHQSPLNVYEEDGPLEYRGPAGPVELLCRVLALFCPEDRLMDQLLEPGSVKRQPRVHPQDVFERGIYWLLTACGFQTILLEECEILRDRETRMVLGTLDALAWLREKSTLLLVACTLGLPKANELDTLNEVKLILRREVPELGELDVRPVVFCRREEVTSTRADAEKVGVVVLGVADLEALWELAKRGDQDGILSILSVPESI